MPRLSGGARNRPFPPQKRGNGRTPANLERLKTQIRQLEGFGGRLADTDRKVLSFGVAAIDDHFPGGGLAQAALHEIFEDRACISNLRRTHLVALVVSEKSRKRFKHAGSRWPALQDSNLRPSP